MTTCTGHLVLVQTDWHSFCYTTCSAEWCLFHVPIECPLSLQPNSMLQRHKEHFIWTWVALTEEQTAEQIDRQRYLHIFVVGSSIDCRHTLLHVLCNTALLNSNKCFCIIVSHRPEDSADCWYYILSGSVMISNTYNYAVGCRYVGGTAWNLE